MIHSIKCPHCHGDIHFPEQLPINEELIDMAHTLFLRMTMHARFDSYTGSRLIDWMRKYESRPTPRAADGVVLLAEDGELQINLNDGSSYRWRPPRR